MKALRVLTAAALLLTASAVACGHIDVDSANNDGVSFPLGVYSDCQWLLTGGTLESASSPASLTLAPICSPSGCSASNMVASFRSGQTTATFTLRATSESSATLSEAGQGFGGEWAFCGGGAVELDGGGIAVSDPAPTEATLSMTSAELTVDHGVAFLQIEGPVVDIQGGPDCPPDGPPSGSLSALLVCDVSSRGASGVAGVPPSTSRFASGTYACTSTAQSVVSYEGTEDHTGSSRSGTLTLTANGPSLTAVYSGDTNANGALDFVVTSDSSANPVPGQTIVVGCGALDPTTLTQVNDPTPAAVSAGALTTDGTSLYLTFLSRTSSSASCSDQTSSTALVCTKGE